jgi:hypothetical protein
MAKTRPTPEQTETAAHQGRALWSDAFLTSADSCLRSTAARSGNRDPAAPEATNQQRPQLLPGRSDPDRILRSAPR